MLYDDVWGGRPAYPFDFQYPVPPKAPTNTPSYGDVISFTIASLIVAFIAYALPKALKLIYNSLVFVWRNAKPKSLLYEETGVEGCGLFSKVRDPRLTFDWYHFLGKVARLLLAFAFAPFFILPYERAWKALKAAWFWERASPYKAVLASAPGGGGMARFNPTGYTPTFLVEVRSRPDGSFSLKQIDYPAPTVPYTAISYSFIGALPLLRIPVPSASSNSSASQDRRYTLEERRNVAIEVVKNYILTLHPPTSGSTAPSWTEYIWIDELCLSKGPRVDDSRENRDIRNLELGRLADIFSRAANVVVFCNQAECKHISLDCHWNSRLFTIAEIFGAQNVISMIRPQSGGFYFDHQTGQQFRRSIQNEAERRNDALHLHAIMKSSPNPVDRQPMIHSLIVEALRRDDLGNFDDHNQLGRGLNGLLARRARLEDVPGKDGWADLCWLLELNQGHFNAASLAAVCSLDAGSNRHTQAPLRHPWLGKPVLPKPGTERLEPLVTAIPVVNPLASQPVASALNIVGPKIIGVVPFPRRDSCALYTHKELRGLFLLACIMFLVGYVHSLAAIINQGASPMRLWFNFFVIGASKLVAETTCLACEGWVHLDKEIWGEDPSQKLGKLDCRLQQLKKWGDPSEQPVPKWDVPSDSNPAYMLDLAHCVFTQVDTLRKPNAMLPLAVHGSGITCMLLDRPDDFNQGSERVGMANLPPYILVQAKRTASVVIGGKVERKIEEGWIGRVRQMMNRVKGWKSNGYTRIEDQTTAGSPDASSGA